MRNPWLAGLVVVLASLSVQGAVLLVPAEYASIQEAIDSSEHGDTVLVSPGLYFEHINFNGKNITVTSTDPNNSAVVGYTILNAEGEGPVVTFENGESSQAMLAGFTLTGGMGYEEYSYVSTTYEQHEYYGAGVYVRYGSPTITRNVIVNCVSPSVQESTLIDGMYYDHYDYSYGGGIYYSGSGRVTYNVIYNNASRRGGGIYASGSVTVANNLIYNNSAVYGGGVYLSYGRLINNTIVGNDTSLHPDDDGYGGNLYVSFPDNNTYVTVSNNIITKAGSGGGLYMYGDGGEFLRYNDVWGNSPVDYVAYDRRSGEVVYGGQASYSGLYGNIGDDPMLMTAWNRRYHLDPQSPCISAGDPNYVPASGETDIDGDPRVYAMIVDIGADEHVGYVKPLANAGADIHVLAPESIELNGADSYFSDPLGVTTYQWSQVLGPTVTLSDESASNPSFTPPEEGWYKFQLIVGDGQYTSDPDTVLVVVGNEAPVADAGPDRLWNVGTWDMLDGSGSSDADPPDELEYSWTQIEGPAIQFFNAETSQPWFLVEEPGVYIFELVVNDGFVDSEPDRVTIEASTFTIETEGFAVSPEPEDDYMYAFYPDVSGTGVVYVGGEYSPSEWSVHWSDSRTGETLTFEGGQINTKPRIDGDVIVWMSGSGSYYRPIRTGIYAVNVRDGQRVTLEQAGGSDSYGYPAISGNTAVWLHYRDVDTDDYDSYADRPFDICGADITDLANPVYFTILADAGRGMPYHYNGYREKADSPIDICGDIVVWESGGDIYGADISNLDDIQVFPICTDEEEQLDPSVSGDVVVWWDQRNDRGDIYGAGISDRTNIVEFEVVVESGTQVWPAIDGPMVVYVDGGTYGGYMYAACLSRQYGAVSFSLPDLPEYNRYVYSSGMAMSGSNLVWPDWDYRITAARLDFAYAVTDGPIENATTGTRHDYIQHAVTAASDGDVIVLEPGIYREKVWFGGRNVTLTSTDPTDPAVRAATVMTSGGAVVTFADGETSDCLLSGLTVTGGAFGIVCNGSTPSVTYCDVTGHAGSGFKLWGGAEPAIYRCNITGNGVGVEMWADTSNRRIKRNRPTIENCVVAGNRFEGIFGGLPTVTNSTIADNLGHGLYCVSPTITGSIVYFNNAGLENLVSTQSATISYSDVQGGATGSGNIDVDPLFRVPGAWSDVYDLRAAWTPGDYHLKSQGWAWDSLQGNWTWDEVTSPCIDAGDPSLPLGDEAPCQTGDPLSERAVNTQINMGAYGGTAEASLAPRN